MKSYVARDPGYLTSPETSFESLNRLIVTQPLSYYLVDNQKRVNAGHRLHDKSKEDLYRQLRERARNSAFKIAYENQKERLKKAADS